MSNDDLMIASAVVIPDLPTNEDGALSAASPTLKRKQSDASEVEITKRARLSPTQDDRQSANRNASTEADVVEGAREASNGADAQTQVAARNDRRRSGREEERKRGQRMFGALLGTLAGAGSRGPGSRIQKRRADIEKRAQEKLQQIDVEGQRKREEDAIKIRAKRRREQWNVDEQVLNANHDSILYQARFLRTRTEPRLFYKPWELLPKEDDLINQQLDDAEDLVDRELEEFEQRRRTALSDLDHEEGRETQALPKEAPDNDHGETVEHEESIVIESAPEKVEDSSNSHQTQSQENLDEHHGETVVEDAEDTVIY